MPCPYLKEVVMLYCDACPLRKMVPLDRLVSASPCLTEDFKGCVMFQQADTPQAEGEGAVLIPRVMRREVPR
jgi:hypothetical protein